MATTEHSDVGGDLLDERAAADHTGKQVRTLQQYRYRGEGPPYFKIGKTVRYSRRDLDAWLIEHRVQPKAS